jgi:hypothetical protein
MLSHSLLDSLLIDLQSGWHHLLKLVNPSLISRMSGHEFPGLRTRLAAIMRFQKATDSRGIVPGAGHVDLIPPPVHACG